MNEKINEKEAGLELRVQDLLMAYLRQWKLIVICVLVGATIAWGVTFFCMTPMYQASATIFINNTNTVNDKDTVTSGDLSAAIYLVKNYTIVAKSDLVLDEVANNLGGNYTAAGLSSAITTSQIENTIVLTLHVSHKDPYEAQRITNELAKVLIDKGPDVIKGSDAQIVDTARVPAAPYSPDYPMNIITGAAAGMLLAIVYATIQFMKDTRIKDENDLTDMFNLPILGRIPDFNDSVTGTRYAETDSEGGEEV
ncbi:MAG: hypothetical protein E7447_04725 [Ruminococcaceae bacterium]|nr:hypothetical protein [Oscillospiraceae bacterium]